MYLARSLRGPMVIRGLEGCGPSQPDFRGWQRLAAPLCRPILFLQESPKPELKVPIGPKLRPSSPLRLCGESPF